MPETICSENSSGHAFLSFYLYFNLSIGSGEVPVLWICNDCIAK